MDNRSPVQGTNDSSILSKHSMVSRGYFEDDAIKHFVRKSVRRSPLINIGYFARAIVMDKSIRRFLESYPFINCQVLSLGAGFDSTYFRLCKLFPGMVFYEVDLTDVVVNKIQAIQQSPELSNLVSGMRANQMSFSFIHLTSEKYTVFEHDLKDLKGLEDKLEQLGFDFTRPTLVFSECAITYMEEARSTDLIKWAAKRLKSGVFMNYEQVNPVDGFGEVMVSHFLKIQNPLKSLAKYRTIGEQTRRYLDAGWTQCNVLSVMELLQCVLPAEEYVRIFKIEPFDEWEELYLKCCHYTLAVASLNSSTIWESKENTNHRKSKKPVNVIYEKGKCLERYAHATVQLSDGGILVVGGFGSSSSRPHGRSSEVIYLGSVQKKVTVSELSTPNICWGCLYCSCTLFGNNEFVIYGGRMSPNKEVNSGPISVKAVFVDNNVELTASTLELEESSNCPPSRWRHTIEKLSESLFLFGGRNARVEVFGDLWELKPVGAKWRWTKKATPDSSWPCSRFSHASTTGGGKMYISGGLDTNFYPLADIWELELEEGDRVRWSKVTSVIPIGGVFNHSMHWHDGRLILLGGVNCSADDQPSLTILDLVTLQPRFYFLQYPGPQIMLHNHASVLVEEESAVYTFGGGGNCFSFGTHFNDLICKIELDSCEMTRS